MRAKIMLLSASERDESNLLYAERILTEISVAFGHTFLLLRDKIGEKARAAHGESLTEKTIAACQDCQAVFVSDGTGEGLSELYDALDLPIVFRSLSVPECLCGRAEAPVSLYVGTVLSLDEDTLRRAMRVSFLLAQDSEMRLCHVSPSGSSQDSWTAAARVQEALFPAVSAVKLSAPEAVTEMILSPQRMGLLLCPPYAGSVLLAAGTALCAHPNVMHDMALEEEGAGVYSALLPKDGAEPVPLSAALASAKLLRCSLRLQREAACLEAAVKNVISSGWENGNESPISGEGVLKLICEQITVAGELMQRGAIGAL